MPTSPTHWAREELSRLQAPLREQQPIHIIAGSSEIQAAYSIQPIPTTRRKMLAEHKLKLLQDLTGNASKEELQWMNNYISNQLNPAEQPAAQKFISNKII